MNPSFFIRQIRSKGLQKKLLELNFMRQALTEVPRKPVTNYHRITSRYQPLLDDYHKLIEEINQGHERESLMMEVIIMLAYTVDYSTNPNTNDEIFKQLAEMSENAV